MKILLLVGPLLLLVVFVVLVIAASRKGPGAWPFYAKRVLSDAEQVLYWRLVEALPEEVVLAQVQLSRFLGVKKGHKRMQWLNRVNQKSADFVVCKKNFAVVTVIELDDSTHLRPARRKADADKERAITAAGLTLLRWNVNKMPSVGEIRQIVYPPATAKLGAGDEGALLVHPTLAAIRPSASRERDISHRS
ncbi:MAG TPA: DUF2726 domain-containing protein [Stenotrophomonas sp.]|nr:DUF2726 domain-containing protein [Stenotrophomonas sp.]